MNIEYTLIRVLITFADWPINQYLGLLMPPYKLLISTKIALNSSLRAGIKYSGYAAAYFISA